MTNVIGPIDYSDWYTMRMLRENIRLMKIMNNTGQYDIAINKQALTYQDFLDHIFANKKQENIAA